MDRPFLQNVRSMVTLSYCVFSCFKIPGSGSQLVDLHREYLEHLGFYPSCSL